MPRRSKTTGTNSESPRPSSPSSIGLITLSARPNTRRRFLSRCSCCRNLGRRRRACCRRTGRKGLGRAQTQLFLNLSFQNAIKCKSLCQMSIQFNRMHRSLYYAYGLLIYFTRLQVGSRPLWFPPPLPLPRLLLIIRVLFLGIRICVSALLG